MVAIAICAWIAAIFFWGAVCSKMAKLDVYLRASNGQARQEALKQPGFWAPESILLALAMPCGLSISVALDLTLRLSGHL